MPPCVWHAAGWLSSQLLAVRLKAYAVQLLLYGAWSTSTPRARLKRGGAPSVSPCV